jgi:hypothetical protein
MRHMGYVDFPDMPPPSPWLMAVVLIGAGVTLWWLTPDMVRREQDVSRYTYYLIAGRAFCASLVIGGLIVLGVAQA